MRSCWMFRGHQLEPRLTPAVTLVADVCTSDSSADTTGVIASGNSIYFAGWSIDPSSGGAFLYKSNGTSAGTVRLRYTSGAFAITNQELADVNGTVYFVRSFSSYLGGNNELWKTDGTDAGTVMVKDIIPGATGSNPSMLTNVSGTLYFTANDGVTGYQLWKTNGTEAGTVRLTTAIAAGQYYQRPRFLTNVNGTLYFAANSAGGTPSLWRSDGTAAGTVPIATVRVQSPINVNGVLYFNGASTAGGAEPWISDGTTTGTRQIANLQAGSLSSDPDSFCAVGSTVYFQANNGTATKALWRTDGTAAGTALVRDFSYDGMVQGLVNVSGKLYFEANDSGLWTSDGTSNGTQLVKGFNAIAPIAGYRLQLTNAAGRLMFTACSFGTGTELWTSDGSSAGTMLVKDIQPGSGGNYGPRNLRYVNGVTYLTANDGVHGYELWRSDGTAAGTRMVFETNGGVGSNPYRASDTGTSFFYTATPVSSQFSPGVRQVFRTDGSGVAAASVGVTPSNAFDIVCGVGSNAYYANGTGDAELWITDGSSTGTRLVRDINTTGSSGPEAMTNFNSILIFVAGDGTTGREIWRSDGTSNGTFRVKDIRPGGGDAFGNNPQFHLLNGILYFAANDGTNGTEVWRTDGTSAGTWMVKDVNPGPASSNPTDFVLYSGIYTNEIYFAANDGVHGVELWHTNASGLGAGLVQDYRPGSAGSYPYGLFAGPTKLYFAAMPPGDGYEPCILNGIPGAPGPIGYLRDVNGNWGGSTYLGSNPASFITVGSTVYFTAEETYNDHTRHLYRTDGTNQGTLQVAEVGVLEKLATVNGIVYFAGYDAIGNYELWRSDGTSSGTFLVDLDVDTVARPKLMGKQGTKLYFSGYRRDVGTEMFVLQPETVAPTIASITTTAGSGVYTTGQQIPVTITFSESVALTSGSMTINLNSGGSLTISAPFAGLRATATYTVGAGQYASQLNASSVTGFTLKDAFGNAANLALPAANIASEVGIIVNPLPPTTVSFVTVNGGAAQRSRVVQLQVSLATPVDVTKLGGYGGITLTRTAGGPPTVVQTGAIGANGRISISPTIGTVSTITLTFSNADGSAVTSGVESGSLADGRWQLRIPGLQYASPMNGPDLRRLFGDANSDGVVAGDDLTALGNAFGSNSLVFDYDLNGIVDGVDITAFGNRFNAVL